jgi:hypothetical protein
MNRRALIIANPGEPGKESYCHGVNRDVDNYKRFLKSPIGGLWREEEIVVRQQPSRAMTTMDIGQQRRTDYSLTVFCGHGYHAADSDSTIIELSSGIDIDSLELRLGAPKHTLILDCCRTLHREMIEEDSAEKVMKGGASRIDPDECRKYYDIKLDKCPPGVVVLFGCSINQTAGDSDSQGGFYSYSLISAAEAWSRATVVDTSSKYRTMSLVEAHLGAVQGVAKMSGGRQAPSIDKPRSEPYFPFCIIA